MRRLVATAAAGLLALTACGSGGGSNGDDITIGLLSSFTGPLAQPSTEAQQGIELALEEAQDDERFDGREINLVIEDDQSEPSVALRKGQKLTTQDGATSIIGIVNSAVGVALESQFETWDAAGMIIGAKTTSLTGPEVNPYLFRAARSDAQDLAVLDSWIDDSPELETWSIIGADYNWGRDNGAAATELLEGADREIVSEEYVATGTTDFGPQINRISGAAPDAVWVALSGQDAINFLKQAQSFGLSGEIPLVGVLLLSNSFVAATGDAAVGAVGNVQYDVHADNELNADFIKAYEAKFNETPTNYAFDGYLGMKLLLEGYAEAESSDRQDLIEALENVEMDTAIGEVAMDPDTHQLQTDGFVGRVTEGPMIDVFMTIPADEIQVDQ